MAAADVSDGTATEHTQEPQLAELLSQEAGLTSDIELKVIRNEIIQYSYKYDEAEVASQMLQVLVQFLPPLPSKKNLADFTLCLRYRPLWWFHL